MQLHKRAEKIAAALTEKGSINTGDNVVLLYPPGESFLSVRQTLRSGIAVPVEDDLELQSVFVSLSHSLGIDLITSFYGCLYAGCVPVTVRPPHPQNLAATLPTVRMIIDVSVYVCYLLIT